MIEKMLFILLLARTLNAQSQLETKMHEIHTWLASGDLVRVVEALDQMEAYSTGLQLTTDESFALESITRNLRLAVDEITKREFMTQEEIEAMVKLGRGFKAHMVPRHVGKRAVAHYERFLSLADQGQFHEALEQLYIANYFKSIRISEMRHRIKKSIKLAEQYDAQGEHDRALASLAEIEPLADVLYSERGRIRSLRRQITEHKRSAGITDRLYHQTENVSHDWAITLEGDFSIIGKQFRSVPYYWMARHTIASVGSTMGLDFRLGLSHMFSRQIELGVEVSQGFHKSSSVVVFGPFDNAADSYGIRRSSLLVFFNVFMKKTVGVRSRLGLGGGISEIARDGFRLFRDTDTLDFSKRSALVRLQMGFDYIAGPQSRWLLSGFLGLHYALQDPEIVPPFHFSGGFKWGYLL